MPPSTAPHPSRAAASKSGGRMRNDASTGTDKAGVSAPTRFPAADRPAGAFGLEGLVALWPHWPEYPIEAAGLGLFMVSACVFATLLEHPSSPVRQAIADAALRRVP